MALMTQSGGRQPIFVASRNSYLISSSAERLGGLEVDYRLVLHRRPHWQVGGLVAAQDTSTVWRHCGSRPMVGKNRPRRDYAAARSFDHFVCEQLHRVGGSLSDFISLR
jgi:hypothetical protein